MISTLILFALLLSPLQTLPPAPTQTILYIAVHDQADILVIDPSGRKIGYSPTDKKVLEQVPNASFNNSTAARPIADSKSVPPPKIEIAQPEPGRYTILVIGTCSTQYTLETTRFFDAELDGQQSVRNIRLRKGEVHRYSLIVKDGAKAALSLKRSKS